MKFLRNINPVWLIVLLGIATRLPQLLNPDIAMDGDECIVGMMVKHTMAGKEFPLYFYGQSYGFTLLEVLFSIPLSAVLGLSTFSIKASMLIMWLTGAVFFYKTLQAINSNHKYLPLILTLLLVSSPAWAVWSMKIRGGYLTAFMLSPIVTWLLFDKRVNYKTWVYPVAGVLLAIVYEAQMLWVVALAPVLFYVLVFNTRKVNTALLLLSGGVILFALHRYKAGLLPNYPLKAQDIESFTQNVSRLPEYLFYSLAGKYYLSENFPDNLFTALFSYTFIAFIVLLPICSIYNLVKGNKDQLFAMSVLAVFGVIVVNAAPIYVAGRFFLPLTGAVIFSAQLLLNRVKISRVAVSGVLSLCVVGIIGLCTFWNFPSGKMSRSALEEIIQRLEEHDVHHVLVTYSILDFQIIFYSDERILARNKWYPGRYTEYLNTVDGVYHSHGNIAVVGYNGEYDGMQLDPTYVTPEYFIAIAPDRSVVQPVFFP